jgi:hydroxymethylglutaryl-CoA lyase
MRDMDFGVTPFDGLPLPTSVTICEVGPRDGLQNESTVLPADIKAEFIDRLVDAGNTVVETTSFVHPKWVPQLADAEEVLRKVAPVPGVRYPVLVPNQRGLDRALDLGVSDIAVFGSVTETFARLNLNRTVDESLEMFAPVVAQAREAGMQVRGYLSMCFGDPWEGRVSVLRVLDVATRMMALGCTELSIGDTIGVATPGQVTAVLDTLIASGIPVDSIAVHFHDTYGQALANALTALRRGITTFDSSAGGLGGCPYAGSATGNLATEDLLWQLHGLGIVTGIDLQKMVDTSVWLARQLGRPSPSRTVTALAG